MFLSSCDVLWFHIAEAPCMNVPFENWHHYPPIVSHTIDVTNSPFTHGIRSSTCRRGMVERWTNVAQTSNRHASPLGTITQFDRSGRGTHLLCFHDRTILYANTRGNGKPARSYYECYFLRSGGLALLHKPQPQSLRFVIVLILR